MNSAPSVIVFDVNETLSDMSPMGDRFAEVGAPAPLAKLWFATLLRDGFALTAAGGNGAFAEIGAKALRGLLANAGIETDLDTAVEHVMAGMAGLGLHPDVPEGVRALRTAGYRLVTLTNGSAQVAEKLFGPAGIRDQFERLLSVEDAPGWKPARAAYDYAAGVCAVAPEQMLLVAVHPWDIHGAAQAGLGTAWINRTGGSYPGYFTAPDYTVASLEELPGELSASGA
ncbi:haloacid dehalogenase type II [Pseudarthrobacter psychrotolerans]|uniref:Haloacid dehalogenase type II n=1 Tax=Pseudarthrobacter psychrotolerans TaxID=2697569 RepID=A0A6P1NN89_9MICC|nr:haloacid dehalogenase type II [Pseudarthrobacter psychrotolerans]QHK21836.1 haloacid dehalogenase type II [Pseudarthrobacter psychrotolerans]